MTLFARDYTNRTLVGDSAMVFKIVDALLTTVPLIIITWVLILLAKKTFAKIGLSNVFLAIAFAGLWFLVIWRLTDKFSQEGNEVDATWFAILNSLFIIMLRTTILTKWWDSRYNHQLLL